jgi:GT2 family glycosyltransferase/SAM-dependent methyltransferase
MDRAYYEHARPELLALVPETARRVLDIGCGAGALGAALRERQECEVIGLEPCEEAARAARERLTRVWPLTVEAWLEDPDYEYDCIILGDVLEHLVDHEGVLQALRACLSPRGCLVISVPNSRNRTVIAQLLRGDYSYTEAGLLDRTHLRLFTRRELQRLLWRCGYEIESLSATREPGVDLIPGGCGVDYERLHVACNSSAEAAEFYHYQYLARATASPPVLAGQISVVIPVWNQLDYTRQCLGSLLRTLPEEAQIVVIDNGSGDSTPQYLDALARRWPGLQVIGNVENLGWVKAVNQGLEAATGESVILLNNDTICPEGWLEPLLRALWTEGVGLAGPLSNNVSGPQQVAPGYQTEGELEGWAWDLMQANRGRLADCPRLVGFCLAVRREVVAQIGGLDERFGIGMYDDDDLCRRAQRAGWRTVIAAGSFVHHFGSVSFRALGAEATNALLEGNAALMDEKWEREA